MNKNSLICQFIKNNPNDWEEQIEKYNISIKKEENLAIFVYDVGADFSNPIVAEARGIIIDLNTLDVVCWAFNKFNNYGNVNADEIDWLSAKVQEKVDGSIIKLWWDKRLDKWRWSTNGNITPAANLTKLINKCKLPGEEWLDTLDKDVTYIFELISPYNQIVIKYSETKLIHLGCRNNLTGQEFDTNIGLEKPKNYDLNTIEDCLDYVKTLNDNDVKIEHEGFVVVDKDFHRIKIKSPEYLVWHRLVTNHSMKKEDFLSMIVFTPEKLDDFCDNYKEYVPYVDFYKKAWEEFLTNVDELLAYIRENLNEDRKELAKYIGKSKYKDYGFKGMGNNKTALELFYETKEYFDKAKWTYNRLFKVVDDYLEEGEG